MITGWYAAPFLIDWNNDGLLDLLVGTSGNVILWWQNIGTKTEHDFSYRGFVLADEERLAIPESPVAEDKTNIFKRDYYNQPWMGDLNE
ncbi:MAG: VCBS repeat-containing protein [Planctomycetaceae bacterium]